MFHRLHSALSSGAIAKRRTSESTEHFELAIPNLALPRAVETPARSNDVGVFNTPVSSPPASCAEGRVSLDPDEVRFEPGAAVRVLFAEFPSPMLTPTIAYSYQPGEDGTFEEVALCQEEGLPSVCARQGYDRRRGMATALPLRAPRGIVNPSRFVLHCDEMRTMPANHVRFSGACLFGLLLVANCATPPLEKHAQGA